MRFAIHAAVVAATVAAANAAAAPVGDGVRGKAVFARCVACHDVRPGVNRLGPSLAGIVGRKAGTVPGFAYSPALKSAKIAWTPTHLDAYLASPNKTLPGTRMIFAGLSTPADRANVIAYLKKPQ